MEPPIISSALRYITFKYGDFKVLTPNIQDLISNSHRNLIPENLNLGIGYSVLEIGYLII